MVNNSSSMHSKQRTTKQIIRIVIIIIIMTMTACLPPKNVSRTRNKKKIPIQYQSLKNP